MTTKPLSLPQALIVEGDFLYACIIGEMLKEGSRQKMGVTLTHSLSEAIKLLRQRTFAIALVDARLPDGEDIADIMHQLHQAAPTLPIIVMTAVDNEQTAAEALRAGAQDYLVKGQFRVQSLVRSIRYASERQRLRLALQAALQKEIDSSEERFREIITANVDGMVVLDQAGLICFVNPGAETLLSRSAADLMGSPFPTAVVAGTKQELIIRHPDHSTAVIELQTVATQWHGQPAELITMRDISSHKKTQRALHQYAAELRAHNEDLDAFAHTVAHDLKNPIGLIIGFTETLNEVAHDLTPNELPAYLNPLLRSARKADGIIQELLLLASVRQEKIESQPLDMHTILHEVQERLSPFILEQHAEIIYPTTWPTSLGYAPWVEEVWANYIHNAIKYGGTPPQVTLGSTTNKNGTISFWVADNGLGLTHEEQSRLFTPFTQLSHVRATGNGLGLSIVRRIINRLGGEVGVRSESGSGSTFFFTLPPVEETVPT